MKLKREYFYPLCMFLLINSLLFLWLHTFHSLISFNTFEYSHNANHYIQDPRISDKKFILINALGQYDSQWYLKIADKGYPDHPQLSFQEDTTHMEVLMYNFFPLYPLSISIVNYFVHNIELSAFILSNLFLLASVYSVFFVVTKWFSRNIAIKTIFLLLLFPFSIFMRGYYSEGLRLLLFIWFCYGLTQKKFFIAAISVGLLEITSGISLLLLPFYWGALFFYKKKHHLGLKKILFWIAVTLLPFILWMFFCYVRTGDPVIFIKTRYAWARPSMFPLFYNIKLLFSLPFLPSRSFYGSRIDVIFIWLALLVTYLAKNVLSKTVWLATILLAFSPLLVQDSVSFARFSCVLFPFFVYLTTVLKGKYYLLVVCFFGITLLVVSLLYINWYWIE